MTDAGRLSSLPVGFNFPPPEALTPPYDHATCVVTPPHYTQVWLAHHALRLLHAEFVSLPSQADEFFRAQCANVHSHTLMLVCGLLHMQPSIVCYRLLGRHTQDRTLSQCVPSD